MHQEYVTSLYYECNVQNMFLFCLKTTKQIQNYFKKIDRYAQHFKIMLLIQFESVYFDQRTL
jgi:hypothetical protein